MDYLWRMWQGAGASQGITVPATNTTSIFYPHAAAASDAIAGIPSAAPVAPEALDEWTMVACEGGDLDMVSISSSRSRTTSTTSTAATSSTATTAAEAQRFEHENELIELPLVYGAASASSLVDHQREHFGDEGILEAGQEEQEEQEEEKEQQTLLFSDADDSIVAESIFTNISNTAATNTNTATTITTAADTALAVEAIDIDLAVAEEIAPLLLAEDEDHTPLSDAVAESNPPLSSETPTPRFGSASGAPSDTLGDELDVCMAVAAVADEEGATMMADESNLFLFEDDDDVDMAHMHALFGTPTHSPLPCAAPTRVDSAEIELPPVVLSGASIVPTALVADRHRNLALEDAAAMAKSDEQSTMAGTDDDRFAIGVPVVTRVGPRADAPARNVNIYPHSIGGRSHHVVGVPPSIQVSRILLAEAAVRQYSSQARMRIFNTTVVIMANVRMSVASYATTFVSTALSAAEAIPSAANAAVNTAVSTATAAAHASGQNMAAAAAAATAGGNLAANVQFNSRVYRPTTQRALACMVARLRHTPRNPHPRTQMQLAFQRKGSSGRLRCR